MHKSYYTVESQEDGYVWSVPEQAMCKLDLAENQMVTLKCGSGSVDVRVKKRKQPHASKIEVMGLSPRALKTLGIPGRIFFRIKKEESGSYRLGPVIGILTFPGHVPHRLGYYHLYAKRNITNGLLYVFRGRAIDVKTRTINAYYYDHIDKQWKLKKMPFPDSVIDRCYPNPYICHIFLEKVIGRKKIFNKRSMIDKIAFCKALDSDEYLRNYTPETLLFHDTSDVNKFLDKYSLVFLKPVNAMKGIGIVAVRRTGNGALECMYTIKGKNYTKIVPTASEIPGVLVAAAGYKRRYVIQQGIQRMEYKGGPFSIRTWAMKNREGKWTAPGMFAKGSFGNGFLTNFTAGAKLIPLKDLYSELTKRLNYTREQINSILTDLTLKTAEALDKKYGPLGELGLDIVFDEKGKPWVIEANGNPGNIPVFIQKEYPAWPNKVFQYPLDYATFLAGFVPGKTEK